MSPSLRLTSIDELDCSFNEIEALPSSIGQCVGMRTFAADHNFLTQLPPEVSIFTSEILCRLRCNGWLAAHESLIRSPHRWATGRTPPCCFYIPTSWSLCRRRWVTCRSSRSSTWATTSESWLSERLKDRCSLDFFLSLVSRAFIFTVIYFYSVFKQCIWQCFLRGLGCFKTFLLHFMD